ncbi:uncharacterized protein TrAFT101_010653 [Trichoderma asperellum]|uniref:uncharacterized protein n=1 Tax=Trichoderma asperellum TaxID=101201 RepID=UPI0033306EC6|nr:hypothetical protein TrAFT101_010653 [Trichoderma asperellum]
MEIKKPASQGAQARPPSARSSRFGVADRCRVPGRQTAALPAGYRPPALGSHAAPSIAPVDAARLRRQPPASQNGATALSTALGFGG